MFLNATSVTARATMSLRHAQEQAIRRDTENLRKIEHRAEPLRGCMRSIDGAILRDYTQPKIRRTPSK